MDKYLAQLDRYDVAALIIAWTEHAAIELLMVTVAVVLLLPRNSRLVRRLAAVLMSGRSAKRSQGTRRAGAYR